MHGVNWRSDSGSSELRVEVGHKTKESSEMTTEASSNDNSQPRKRIHEMPALQVIQHEVAMEWQQVN